MMKQIYFKTVLPIAGVAVLLIGANFLVNPNSGLGDNRQASRFPEVAAADELVEIPGMETLSIDLPLAEDPLFAIKSPEVPVEEEVIPDFAQVMTEDMYLSMLDSDNVFTDTGAANPLVMSDLIEEIRLQGERVSEESVHAAMSSLMLRFPFRDSGALMRWIDTSENGIHGLLYEMGDQFAEMGDHLTAFQWYRESAAESGSSEAFFQLGSSQLTGRGTKVNYLAAQQSLFAAMRDDHPDAAYLLGVIYLSGVAGKSNEVHAYRLFQSGIEAGSRYGYAEAGRMREMGKGIRADLSRAIELYRLGAEFGDSFCIQRLVGLDKVEKASWQMVLPQLEQPWVVREARRLIPRDFFE